MGASGDTWIGPGNPAATHGSETELHVDANAMGSERTLVAFNISSGVPGDATIESATLTLCMRNILALSVGRTHMLYRVTTAWQESTASWNSLPSVETAATDAITVPLITQCVDFDVTADVAAWQAGTANYGWMLRDSSENGGLTGVNYGSREGAAADRPVLTIVFIP